MSLDSKWRVALESGERSVPVTDMRTSYDREQINAESDWNRPHDGIHEYRVKIDMVSAAAERTKSSVLEKYGDCISEKQQIKECREQLLGQGLPKDVLSILGAMMELLICCQDKGWRTI